MRLITTALLMLCMTQTGEARTCAKPPGTLFQNVTVANGDGSVQAGVDVLVAGKRGVFAKINAHDPEADPACAVKVDGTGKYLVPGMVEMHGHLPRAGWSDMDRDETYFLYVAAGVTTVRGMLGNDIQFDHREQIEKRDLLGPQLFLAAPSLNGNSVSSPEAAREMVRDFKARGYDLLKIHPGLTRDEYMAMADEAKKTGIDFGGHVPDSVTVVEAMATGQISLDHMDGYTRLLKGLDRALSEEDIARAVSETAKYDTWIVPTQVLFNLLRSGGDVDAMLAREENRYMAKSTLANWERRARRQDGANKVVAENRQRLLKALSDSGANIVMGSDAPQIFSVPGFSIWREIDVMKDAGISDADIFRIATIEAGRYFDKTEGEGCFGKVAKGCRADAILIDGNPLEDINAIKQQSGVLVKGLWLARHHIDARLEKIAARHASE